jgi:hypothetical protein
MVFLPLSFLDFNLYYRSFRGMIDQLNGQNWLKNTFLYDLLKIFWVMQKGCITAFYLCIVKQKQGSMGEWLKPAHR